MREGASVRQPSCSRPLVKPVRAGQGAFGVVRMAYEADRLFETALVVAAPWYVGEADFDAQVRTLTIRVDFASGTRSAMLGAERVSTPCTTRCASASRT